MQPDTGPELGLSLRNLRLLRRASLDQAAIRCGVSKSSLSAWENGRCRPRGEALERLLDGLRAGSRTRARLLAAADPVHAQWVLPSTLLGAPVPVGVMVRAMRIRKGFTQADLASHIGLAQTTVARWESGESQPNAETLQAVAYALGATGEEAVALACARGACSGRLSNDPYDFEDPLCAWRQRWKAVPEELQEIYLLGIQAEIWPRAARDHRWDAMLGFVISARACRYYGQGRLREAEETARRALRLGKTAHTRTYVTGAISALLEVATYDGKADPTTLALQIERWIGKIPDSATKAWMLWEQALRLAETDRADEAVDLTERSTEMTASFNSETAPFIDRMRLYSLLEVEMRAGRIRRAEHLFSEYAECNFRPDVARRHVRIAHLRHEAAAPEQMEAMRVEYLGTGSDNWDTRMKIAKLERAQLRLNRRSRKKYLS